MDVSYFLAKVVGLYLILSGLMIALKHNNLRQIINEYFDSPTLVMIGGMMSIIIGLLLVVSHSVWVFNWKLIITVFGYLALFKGILHWFFTETAASWASKVSGEKFHLYASIVMIMLGIYLSYIGFFIPGPLTQ